MEFSRPEYWSGYPFPSPGYLPNPGIEPRSPALQVDSLPAEPQGKPILTTFDVLHSKDLERCIMTYNDMFPSLYYTECLHCPRNPPIHLFNPPTIPGIPSLLNVVILLLFPECHIWNRSVCI